MNTRKLFLEAAERLIREKGISRLTTKQIAQAAGLAEGTLFNQFGSKDNLILAVIAERAPQNLLNVVLEHGPQFLEAIGTAGENNVQANLRGTSVPGCPAPPPSMKFSLENHSDM